MSDWAKADDYTTLEEVFASPDFTRAPSDALVPRSAFVATAAAARRPLRSLRNRAIASLSLAGAAVSFVGAVIIGSGPVGIPLASAPSNPQSTGGSVPTQAGSQQQGSVPSGGGGAGLSTATNAGNGASAAGSSVVFGSSSGGTSGSGGAAAGGTLHASLVSDTFPAPTTTTTTPPAPTTTTTTPPISAGGANGKGNDKGNSNANVKGAAGGHDNGGGNGGQNNGHGNGK